MSGPIDVARSQAGPTRRLRTASARRRRKPGIVVHGCLHDGQAGRRALLAGVPEGGVDQVGDGLVEIGGGGDDHGVLAAGFGVQRQAGPPAQKHPGRLPRAGQDHRVHVRVGDEPPAGVPVHAREELQHGAGHAALPQRLGQLARRWPPFPARA